MSPTMRSVPLLAALALAAACADRATAPAPSAVVSHARPEAAAAMGPQQQVTGSAFIQIFGGTVPENYSFSAIRHRDGDVSGQFELKSAQDGGLRVHGEVTCMAVTGNVARLGGVLTQSTDAQFPAGTQVAWMIADNGEGANDPPDQTSDFYVSGNPSRFCASQARLPLIPIEHGNLQVHE